MKQLRHRPFLVIETLFRPHEDAKTSQKGWKEMTGNMQVAERYYVVDRIKDKMLSEATVIVDLLDATCIKNRYEAASDDEVANHYIEKYQETVEKGIEEWTLRYPDKAAEVLSMAETTS